MRTILNKAKVKYKNLSLPAKASLWFMFTSVVNKGVSFITTPIFTRFLTQTEYGLLNIYNTWLQIVTIFATFELATGVFNKAMIKFENDRDGYTSSSLILTTCLTGITALIYFLGKGFWNAIFSLTTFQMILMFSEIFFTTAWQLYAIRNRFDYKYKTIVAVTIVTNIAASLLSIILIILFPDYRVEAKILGIVIIRAIIYGFFYIRILIKGKVLYRKEYWIYSLRYNLPLIPHYLSQLVLNQSDRVMISRMCGNADAGAYSLAYQAAFVIQIFINAIQASFAPWCFQSIKNGKLKNIGKRAFQIELFIGIICLMFSLFAPEMVQILGGESYYRAVYIVPPVSMSILFLTLYSFFGNIEFYFEKTKLVMIASCIVAIANLILNYIFISIYGFVAAGYTTLVCYICYSIIHYYLMLIICKTNNVENPFPFGKMWTIALSFAAISIIVSLVYRFTLIRYCLIVITLMIGIVYFKKYKKDIVGV